MKPHRPAGMFGFTIVWIGQLISLLGTNMTGFALTIWAYEITGSATALALVGFFFITPMLIFSPFAGAIVDRSNRKLMMMVSDLASGVATIIILILHSAGQLQIWHLYITGAFQGLFQAFQWPAYSAAITTMLPKEQYARANGMMSLVEAAPGIFSPLLAGALLAIIGLPGILTIDIITFVAAIGALLAVHIPQPQATAEGQAGRGTLLREAGYGFRYILQRPSLLGLQIVFLLGNFFVSIAYSVLAPMILASTGNNELALGSANSAGAIGGVVGGVLMSAWGGPKRLVHGVLGGWFVSSLLGVFLMGLGRGMPVWIAASFFSAFFVPLINGSNQAIWQSKVAPDIQGRVFSIRRLIAWFVNPLAMLIAGPLADFVLEPAMHPGGALAGTFGWLVGVGPGRGMALMFVFTGMLASLVGLGGYAVRYVREAETILPDHRAAATPPPPLSERHRRLQELLAERQRLIAAPPSAERQQALKMVSLRLRQLGHPSADIPAASGS
jgi:DHA3 family macrolide efflux protein-like MFS transporter